MIATRYTRSMRRASAGATGRLTNGNVMKTESAVARYDTHAF